MSKVLIRDSQVKCSHQGTVQLGPGAAKLKVNGKPVLLDADIQGMSVSGCTNTNTSAGQKPCTVVASLAAGAATKLAVSGTPVRLETTNGTTDSTPPGTLAEVQAKQAKLSAK